MRPAIGMVVVALAACGGGTSAPADDASPEDAMAVVVRPPDVAVAAPDAGVAATTAACAAARAESLGAAARCVEEVIVEAPKGSLVRVWDRDDAYAKSVLVVVTADGRGHADWMEPPLHLLLPAAPAIQAQICAAKLGGIVRCPDCAVRRGRDVEATVETFYGHFEPERFEPELWRYRWDHACAYEGHGLDVVDPSPPPRLAWVTPPPFGPVSIPVPPPLGDQVCAAARTHLGPDIRCQAWSFPGLETSLGSIFYVSTDAGREDALVRGDPDGSLRAGDNDEIFDDLWPPLLADVRAGRLAPETLVALRLLAAHVEARVTGPYAVREDPEHGLAVALMYESVGRDGVPWASRIERGRHEVILDGHTGFMIDHAQR